MTDNSEALLRKAREIVADHIGELREQARSARQIADAPGQEECRPFNAPIADRLDALVAALAYLTSQPSPPPTGSEREKTVAMLRAKAKQPDFADKRQALEWLADHLAAQPAVDGGVVERSKVTASQCGGCGAMEGEYCECRPHAPATKP